MRPLDRIGLLAGLLASSGVVLFIYAGSSWLSHFDWALTAYALACVVSAFAVAYRYAVWAQRPPTWMYLKRGLQSFTQRKSPGRSTRSVTGNVAILGSRLLDNFALQRFISRRSTYRWLMHACISWGGMVAFALTFPLVFGWIHFESLPQDAAIYRVLVFGFPVEEFPVHSIRGFLHFNLLNVAAVLMLAGLVLAIWLRLTDKGERAIQGFADDVFPLLLLLSVAVTGLMLTVSSTFLGGTGFPVIALSHAVSVIGLLLYLPFGKLFHFVQRPLSLGVSLYKEEGRNGPQAFCLRCGNDYASRMHVEDLKTVLDQVGFNFRFACADGEIHYQEICPACRRRLIALNQGRTLGR